MKRVIGIALVVISLKSHAWQVTLSCTGHGKKGADVEELTLKNTDGKPRETAEDIEVSGTAKKVILNKKTFSDVGFKGTRSQSIKGSFYNLESDPEHKAIKSIKIKATDSDELGTDELVTVDKKSFSMSCNEMEIFDCALPEIPAKVPKDSIWAGGCDGGAWIQVIELKGKKAHLKIFFSDTGVLWKDSWFEFTENCQAKTKELLKSDLSSFDGDMVHLRRVNPKEEPPQNCYLKPIK